jgi:hypothetical protein
MKKTVVSLLLSFLMLSTFAAESGPETELEKAMHTKGSLYKQEVFTVDNIPAFRIDAVKVTDLEKFTISSGLKIIHRIQIGKELKTFYNFIDADEISGISTALQYMKTILKSKTTPGNYTEIKFTSKSGFQVLLSTILNEKNQLDWSFSIHTNITNERTLVNLPADDIDKLQKTLDQAKAKL